MVRKNHKQQVITYENCIRKSNELSMAKLNKGLSLNQMQLLAYAIFSTQQNGKTDFNKVDFEKKFGLEKYQTKHAKDDSQRILDLKFSIEDIENDRFEYYNVFQSIKYDSGFFHFKWTDDMLPHILELKEKYITTDLTITSNFKSGFSWVLYDYLKAHYGYWHKPVSKEALLKLFGVENKNTYQKTAQFKRAVLDVAINEINKYTEFEVWYKEEKEGRSIIGFDLHWSSGEKIASATAKQIKELDTTISAIHDDMFKYINLNDENKREQAIQLVQQTEKMKIHTKEPITITKKHADGLLWEANAALQQLENLYTTDGEGEPITKYNPYSQHEGN